MYNPAVEISHRGYLPWTPNAIKVYLPIQDLMYLDADVALPLGTPVRDYTIDQFLGVIVLFLAS